MNNNSGNDEMLMEHEILPYAASELPPGPWLTFAPHPDDETFGLGGSMLLARQQNIPTHVVFVTDGALGGGVEKTAMVEKRMQEAKQATTAMGVAGIYFFAEPDRGLQVCDRLINKISALIADINPRSIFIPTPLEYHPDHRATAQLVWKSVQGLRNYGGDVYAYEVSNLAPVNLLIDTSSVAQEKYEIVKIYASQLTESKYMALVKAVDTARTFSLPLDSIAAEGFFKFTDRNASLEQQLSKSIQMFFAGL